VEREIYLPRPDRRTTSCRLVEWRKEEGDVVGVGDILLIFESQKSSMHLESPVSGILKKRLAPSGAWAQVGKPVGVIETG
jgi:pyruvate/2-oxoglutarate dehydrogenase complex dihydrolipoamide acyltransferase (E2) component